jgi:hypothetical protein
MRWGGKDNNAAEMRSMPSVLRFPRSRTNPTRRLARVGFRSAFRLSSARHKLKPHRALESRARRMQRDRPRLITHNAV